MVDLGKILGAGTDVKRLQEVVDFVLNRKDDLIVSAQLAAELPALLKVLATGLAESGKHASNAGTALTGASGATGRLSDGTKAMASISTSLTVIAKLVGDAADDVAKVPLMSGPAKELASAAHALGDTKANLDALAGNLDEVSAVLNTVGKALEQLGTSLGATGGEAAKLAGG